MCMEDVRIGRRSTTTTSLVATVAGTPKQLLTQNPDRYAFRLSDPSASLGAFVCGAQDPTTIAALVPARVADDLILDIQHHGDMVTQPWFYLSAASSPTILVTESVLEDE